jgi:hypothetical protein
MPAGNRVYSSSQVKVSLAGIPITGGFADGEFVRIEREGEAFTDVVGTDGEVTRNATKDNRATVTIILMQSGEGNAALSALHNSDKNTEGGAGIGRLLIEDLNGTSLHESAFSWISNEPDASYDREATSREWPVRCANLIQTLGGYF